LIFTTSDNLTDDTRKFVEESGIPFVQKPFSAEEITGIAEKLMAGDAEKSAKEAAVHHPEIWDATSDSDAEPREAV